MSWTPDSLSPAMRAALSHLTGGYELHSRQVPADRGDPAGVRYWVKRPGHWRRIALDRVTVDALRRRGLLSDSHLTDKELDR